MLRVIYGPMYSGKTTRLLEIVGKLEMEGTPVLKIKHCIDQRYDGKKEDANLATGWIRSHNGGRLAAYQTNSLMAMTDELRNYEWVAVDEGCFFDDIMEFTKELGKQGKNLIVAGLDLTYDLRPFGHMQELIDMAQMTEHYFAQCRCGSKACYTERLIHADSVIVVGGREMYSAACAKCHVIR
jgi:thymidine kinase